jgi:ankyrin
VDCGSAVVAENNSEEVVAVATKVYNEAVAVPILARFVVYGRRHLNTEAQLRVLCLTSDFEISTTLESQQGFHEVGRSSYIEVLLAFCMFVFCFNNFSRNIW